MATDPMQAEDLRYRVNRFLRWFVPAPSSTPAGILDGKDVLSALKTAAAETGLFSTALATAGVALDRMPHPVTFFGLAIWFGLRFVVAMLIYQRTGPDHAARWVMEFEPFPLPDPIAPPAPPVPAPSPALRPDLDHYTFSGTVSGVSYPCSLDRTSAGVAETATFDVGAGGKTIPLQPGWWDQLANGIMLGAQTCMDAWALWIKQSAANVNRIGPPPACTAD